jgi:nucleoid-associated protein YgaU
MADLKTDFMLFKPDGTPVRAKLIAKFKQFTDPATKAKENNNSSPDLTHIKTVVDGDNLPMLCYKVYGDARYYIQVAEYNGLINFNTLVPNQRIIFPRLTHD